MHISTVSEADGFVERNGPIIFAIFKPERAYLVDVGNHGDWANENLIRTIIETWPNDGLAFEMKGITAGEGYSNEGRGKLRAVGYATYVQIERRVFVPGGGLSTAGTSSKASVMSEG